MRLLCIPTWKSMHHGTKSTTMIKRSEAWDLDFTTVLLYHRGHKKLFTIPTSSAIIKKLWISDECIVIGNFRIDQAQTCMKAWTTILLCATAFAGNILIPFLITITRNFHFIRLRICSIAC